MTTRITLTIGTLVVQVEDRHIESTEDFVRLLYDAALATGHAPINLAAAFADVGREHLDALDPPEPQP